MKFAITILTICLLSPAFYDPNVLGNLEFELVLLGFLLSFTLDFLVKRCSISTLGKLGGSRKLHIKHNLLWILLSHGYFLSTIFKDSIKDNIKDSIICRAFHAKQEKLARAKFIQKANLYNLWASSATLAAIAALSSITEIFREYESFKAVITWLVIFRVQSRSIEIVYAFSKDVISEEKNLSTLTKYDRIQLALKSYIENIVNYGVVYYLFNMTSISSAILVSIGRSTVSNVAPSKCLLDQILAYGQVLTTLSLVVLSLAIYVSRVK